MFFEGEKGTKTLLGMFEISDGQGCHRSVIAVPGVLIVLLAQMRRDCSD